MEIVRSVQQCVAVFGGAETRGKPSSSLVSHRTGLGYFPFTCSRTREWTPPRFTFDVIVYGTGLPESLLAAAAAVAGKSVLHLDPNPFYGSHFSSLDLPSFSSFLRSTEFPGAANVVVPPPVGDSDASYDVVPLHQRRLYSEIEISEGSTLESQRGFLLDLAGPRLLYCADAMVDLMIKSGASHHVDFKSVSSSLIYWEQKLCPVPDSRQAIFKDRTLGLAEKSQMTKFLKLVQRHFEAEGRRGETAVEEGEDNHAGISPEDLEVPFADFLHKQRLPPKIRAVILYAIALADFDQDNKSSCKKLITSREGIDRISLYTRSVARLPNAVGAFIYPMYGHGELPQAFCRCAAVKGTLYVLRMPVAAVLVDKETKQCKGVRLVSGQNILSHHLVMESSYKVPSPAPSSEDILNGFTASVARAVCIISHSIVPDSSEILVVFPPKSLHSEQLTAVRALQISSNLAVCPPGLFLVYLSTACDDALVGKEYIKAAINALFRVDGSEGISREGNIEEEKPDLKWSAVYVQEMKQLFTSLDSEAELFPEKTQTDLAEDVNSSE